MNFFLARNQQSMTVVTLFVDNTALFWRTFRSYQRVPVVIELRLDFIFPDLDLVQTLKKASQRPLILTCRAIAQGGYCHASDLEQRRWLYDLAATGPDFLDVEARLGPSICQDLAGRFPTVQLIRSQHMLNHTPKDLDAAYAALVHPDCARIKLIPYAQNTNDALRLMVWLQQQSAPIICHSSGPWGASTRLMAPILGSKAVFVAPNTGPNPQQLPRWDDWQSMVPRCGLTPYTAIYGLIGHPTDQSPGHRYHNQAFQQAKRNAVYVKWDLPPAALDSAKSYLEALNVAGLSVTMPFKATVQSWCHPPAPGPMNTLLRHGNRWIGINTDGLGMRSVLAQDHNDWPQSVLILGAGGSAIAIAQALCQQNMNVSIANRSQRPPTVPASLPYYRYDQIPATAPFAWVISTLPADAEITARLKQFLTPILANRPQVVAIAHGPSPFLQWVSDCGCPSQDGTALFSAQAQRQQHLFNHPFQRQLGSMIVATSNI